MSTLLIGLNASEQAITDNTEWGFAVLADSGLLAEHGSAPAAQLPSTTQAMAIVPAAMLSWQRIDVPKAPAGRMRAALGGLLEDKLLDEPENLHLALQPEAKPGSAAWVAVCSKVWLQNQLQALQAAGRVVSRVVPEVAPLGLDATAQLHVSGLPEQAVLTWADSQGVQRCPLQAWPMMGLSAEAADISAEPAVAAQAEATLNTPQSIRMRSPAQRWAQAASSAWNLAQFELARYGHSSAMQGWANRLRALAFTPQFKPLRWGLALLLLVNLLGLNAYAWMQQRSLNAKRDEVSRVLTQTFPQVKAVVDAPVQMQREVSNLRQATGGVSERDLDVILNAISAAAPENSAGAAIEFVAGELKLRATNLAPQAAQRLGAAGYTVSQEGVYTVVRSSGVTTTATAAPKPGAAP
jgi:general secretion pathway protein L